MQDLFPTQQINGIDFVDSRLVAQDLGINHKSFLENLRKYKPKLEEKFGVVPFKTAVSKSTKNPPVFALLNEGHALSITTLSRNTERVIDVKLKLTDSFLKAKNLLQQPITAPTQLDLAKQVVQLLEQQALDASKVEYHDKVLDSVSTYSTTQVAKDVGLKSAISLNRKLALAGIQYKTKDKQWLLTADYSDKGYTKTKTHTYVDSNTEETKTKMRTVWTEKGRQFIHALFNNPQNA